MPRQHCISTELHVTPTFLYFALRLHRGGGKKAPPVVTRPFPETHEDVHVFFSYGATARISDDYTILLTAVV